MPDFVSNNPFVTSMEDRMAFGTQQSQREAELARENAELKSFIDKMPWDLRRATADAQLAESQNRVAQGTEESDIGLARSNANRAETQANEAQYNYEENQANRGVRDESAQIGLRNDRRAEQESNYDFAERQANRGNRDREAAAGARQAEAEANAAELELSISQDARKIANMKQSIEALRQGNPALAQEFARMNGVEIPKEILENENLQAAMVRFWDEAERLYPNQPQRQLQYMRNAIQNMMSSATQNGYHPSQSLMSSGVPQPPAQTQNPLSGATLQSGSGPTTGLGIEDTRLLQRLEEVNQVPVPGMFNQYTIDRDAMARDLVAMGRPDLARIYDPSIQPPQQQQQPGGGYGTPPIPTPLQNLPGLQYNPGRGLWRDGNGNVYDAAGKPIQ